jgi:hypothetical protein
MNTKFDNILKKYLKENLDNAATAVKSAEGSSLATPAGALKTTSDLLKKEAEKVNPNMPKTPVEQLQALVDPENKNVTHVNQVKLTPELEKHLKDVGLVSSKTNEQPKTSSTTPSSNTSSVQIGGNTPTASSYTPNQVK